MQSGVSGKISRLALLVSEYDITVSYVKGTKNKAADGLSRAYDDGLTKFDDQITARHPALEYLDAPEIKEGVALKLTDYLVECEDYLNTHWPEALKKYENQQIAVGNDPDTECLKKGLNEKTDLANKLKSEMSVEVDYVNNLIQEAAILHIDRSSVSEGVHEQRNKVHFPFKINNDFVDKDDNSLYNEENVDTSDDETTSSDDTGYETTDSSFKVACFNIRLVAINESSFSIPAFVELQNQDEFCSAKIKLIEQKDTRTRESGYFLKRKILMRQLQTRDGQLYTVVCVPQVLTHPLMESTHGPLLSGHFGSARYLLNMSRKYYWPKMRDDIIDFHRQCLACQYNDKFPVKYTLGHVIRPLYPMHVVHCDLVIGLPKALDGSYAILLLYDGFSRFTFGIPLASEKADYVIKKLMSHFVAAFGLPWALHSDNGRNLDGALMRHLANMLGVLKTSTPPYTPNANPTETMCGAVSMLLRKALSESDQRYWSLGLPFILNALNSTVHTATGYTPNSLFFGKFRERESIPIIPFDAESANVNEYFQKMRRFQELAFQIVRRRNERKLLAKQTTWNRNAKIHPYKNGDFVLIKNKAPASGPGKAKLRAKYIGPFRVLKAYLSSLIVIPWTENSRMEQYYKDPDIFRLIHRGDIKPFHTRQVATKHCKPFRGDVNSDQIIDPIMLNKFLHSLNVDSKSEILSEIDIYDNKDSVDILPGLIQNEPVNSQSLSENKIEIQNDFLISEENIQQNKLSDVQNTIVQHENVVDSYDYATVIKEQMTDSLINNLNISERDKNLLRKYFRREKEQSIVSVRDACALNKMREIMQFMTSPHSYIRLKAEREFVEILNQIKNDLIYEDKNIPRSEPSWMHEMEDTNHFIDNLDTSEEDKEVLRKFFTCFDKALAKSNKAIHFRKKIDELEKLIKSSDSDVRKRAAVELASLLDLIKHDLGLDSDTIEVSIKVEEPEIAENIQSDPEPDENVEMPDDEIENISLFSEANISSGEEASPSEHSEITSQHVSPIHSNDGEMPVLEWDDHYVPLQPDEAEHEQDQEVNIRTPNMMVNIRMPAQATPPSANRRSESFKLFQSAQSVGKYSHMQSWLSKHHGVDSGGASTSAACNTPVAERRKGEGDVPTPPTVTKSGRISKPVLRFDDVIESRKQRESRDVRTAIARSKLTKVDEEQKKESNTGAVKKSQTSKTKKSIPSTKKK
jgi:hypothetical protein